MRNLFLLTLLFAAPAFADQGPIHFQDQTDETDTYAIPLDSSEAEENQEMKEFQQESNNYLKKQ